MEELLAFFLKQESVFALLFVALFVFHVKQAREREATFNKTTDEKLNNIEKDVSLLVVLWKTLIEEEVKHRKIK